MSRRYTPSLSLEERREQGIWQECNLRKRTAWGQVLPFQAWGQVLPFAPSQALNQASPFAPYADKTERNLANVPSFAIGV